MFLSKAAVRQLRSQLCGEPEPGPELSALLRLLSLLHQEERKLLLQRDGVGDGKRKKP